MYMTQKLLFTTALLSTLSSYPAYAAKEVPTDPYSGEPIEWDLDGVTGEEGAGLETDNTYEGGAYLGETGPVISGSTAEAEPLVTQSVTIRLGGTGATFDDGDIVLTLYRDGFHREDIVLQAKTGFYLETVLPIGHYTFGKAESSDGKNFTLEETTFDITEGVTSKLVLREKTAEEENLMETYEVAEIPEYGTAQKIKNGILPVIAGVLALSAVITAVVLIRRRRR